MEKDCKERKRDQKSGRDRTRKTVGIGYSVRFGLKLIFNQLKSIIYTPPPHTKIIYGLLLRRKTLRKVAMKSTHVYKELTSWTIGIKPLLYCFGRTVTVSNPRPTMASPLEKISHLSFSWLVK